MFSIKITSKKYPRIQHIQGEFWKSTQIFCNYLYDNRLYFSIKIYNALRALRLTGIDVRPYK